MPPTIIVTVRYGPDAGLVGGLVLTKVLVGTDLDTIVTAFAEVDGVGWVEPVFIQTVDPEAAYAEVTL